MTPILTEIGEVGVEAGGQLYRFRPSFYAMTQIGTPAAIVAAYVALQGSPQLIGSPYIDAYRVKRFKRDQVAVALDVLHACCPDYVGDLVGGLSVRGGYQPGLMPLGDVLAIAAGLMRHGVIGDAPPEAAEGAKASDYSPEFKARDYAASAMAHLGATETEAWAMTMTSYYAAMRAKFPPQDKPGGNAPTSAQHDEAMTWLQRVNEARRNG